MFAFFAEIFGYVLQWIYNIVGNYGVAIILFSLFTKIVLLPLTIKQQKSLELNKKMQPIMQELQTKYKDDQQKMAEEYQKIMKENKFNPFGGCVLALIQLPLIIGMLYVVGRPLTYMVKMSPEAINTRVEAIMPEDYEGTVEQYIVANRYVELKVVKNENLLNLNFFGIDLGAVASEDKSNFVLLIIPVLSMILTYLSVYVINGKQDKKVEAPKNANGEEIPMPNMKVMNAMLPIMSGYIAYIVPLGLGVYWSASSLIQIVIQVAINKKSNIKDI